MFIHYFSRGNYLTRLHLTPNIFLTLTVLSTLATEGRFVISVLLIDDDPDLLYITGLALGEEEDFSLTPCSSPADALKLAQSQRFDAIVCDYYMPGMDGCSLMSLLRQNGSSAQHILFSGKGPDEEIPDSIPRNIDVYVQRRGNPAAEYRELKEIIRTAFSAVKEPL